MDNQKVLIDLVEYNNLLKLKLNNEERKRLKELEEFKTLSEEPIISVDFSVTYDNRWDSNNRNNYSPFNLPYREPRPSVLVLNIDRVFPKNSSGVTEKGLEVLNYFKQTVNTALFNQAFEVKRSIDELVIKQSEYQILLKQIEGKKEEYIKNYKEGLSFRDKLILLFNAN